MKNMTTSVETVIKLACTNLAGTLFFCVPCLKLLYELQAPIIGGGEGWNEIKIRTWTRKLKL